MICPFADLLAAAVPVTNIIGTNPMRCYLFGHIPQATGADPNSNIPCVDWMTVGGSTENLLADAPACDYVRIRIRCWALTATAADALGDAVRTACQAGGYDAGLNPDGYDTETLRFCVSFDFRFIVKRP